MITEVLLVLPLYLILFFTWWRFRPLIKAITDVENVLNDDDFFGDIIDTPREGTEQHKKQECLKSVIARGRAHWWARLAMKLSTKRTLNTSSVN